MATKFFSLKQTASHVCSEALGACVWSWMWSSARLLERAPSSSQTRQPFTHSSGSWVLEVGSYSTQSLNCHSQVISPPPPSAGTWGSMGVCTYRSCSLVSKGAALKPDQPEQHVPPLLLLNEHLFLQVPSSSSALVAPVPLWLQSNGLAFDTA